jgi:hypothetical protein
VKNIYDFYITLLNITKPFKSQRNAKKTKKEIEEGAVKIIWQMRMIAVVTCSRKVRSKNNTVSHIAMNARLNHLSTP